MVVLATSKGEPPRSTYCEKSTLVVLTSIALKLKLLVLPLIVALAVPSLCSTYINIVVSFLSRFSNGCNPSPNHAFLVLNSIIAAIAATSKINRSGPAAIQNTTAKTVDTELQKIGRGSEHDGAQQACLRVAEKDLDISGIDRTRLQAFNPEDTRTHQQERILVSHSKNDPEVGSMRRVSPLPKTNSSDFGEPRRSKNPTEPKLLLSQQATEGDTIKDIWRAITVKRPCPSSIGRIDKGESNQAFNPEDMCIRQQERILVSHSKYDPEVGSMRRVSLLPKTNSSDLGEPHRSMNPTEPRLLLSQQATEGDTVEDIWRAITAKSPRPSSIGRMDKGERNQAFDPEDMCIQQQERILVSHSKYDPEDGSMRRVSPLPKTNSSDFGEPHRSMNPTEPKLLLSQQATEGDTMEDIWRAITAKRPCPSSIGRMNKGERNQAVRRAPATKRRLARCANPISPAEYDKGDKSQVKSRSPGRKPSTGLEELNRKSEAFIAKFSAQIRLEREESNLRYMRIVHTANSGICR